MRRNKLTIAIQRFEYGNHGHTSYIRQSAQELIMHAFPDLCTAEHNTQRHVREVLIKIHTTISRPQRVSQRQVRMRADLHFITQRKPRHEDPTSNPAI